MWNLPGPGIWTHVPCIGRWVLNHWTTREVPKLFNFKLLCFYFHHFGNLSLRKYFSYHREFFLIKYTDSMAKWTWGKWQQGTRLLFAKERVFCYRIFNQYNLSSQHSQDQWTSLVKDVMLCVQVSCESHEITLSFSCSLSNVLFLLKYSGQMTPPKNPLVWQHRLINTDETLTNVSFIFNLNPGSHSPSTDLFRSGYKARW